MSAGARGRSTRGRRAISAALVLCLLLSVALLAADVWVSGRLDVWVTCGYWVTSGIVAVAGAALACTAATSPSDREGWRLLLAGAVLWLAAVTIYSEDALAGAYPPSPSVSDISWLSAGVVSAVGITRLGHGRTRRRDLSWLELAPLWTAIAVLLPVLFWRDIEASTSAPPAVAAALAYPIIYVATAAVMLQAVVSGSLRLRHNWGLGALMLGLMVEAAAFIAWAPPLLDNTYVAGESVLDAFWAVGMLMIGVGSWAVRPVQARADLGGVRNRGVVLPTASLLMLAVVLFIGTSGDLRLAMLSGGVAIVGGLLGIREAVLRRANSELRHDSRTDPLMGIANRLQMEDDLREAFERSEAGEETYAVALFDLDRFKVYNDRLGHQAGDLALKSLALLLDGNSRGQDRIYRYGGEELLLLLRGVDVTQAHAVVDRLRQVLEQERLAHPGNDPYDVMTISAGVACAEAGERPAAVVQRADEALYRAKADGRNRVVADGRGELPAVARIPWPRRSEETSQVADSGAEESSTFT
ncbi:GGDEF domain-containing protein [Kineosporia rhizophila]|uniref:GGDEF domain-containing protein n=1 Tax=Kineosporia rhizophila TaxID=84633 RepID=UPI001E298ACC|nr:GGDEF domain-containing protein [Kineosporia rhizophila]